MISKNQLRYLQSLHQKKVRWQEKLFVAEGIKVVVELLQQQPRLLHSVYALPEFMLEHQGLISAAGTAAQVVSEEELQRISSQAQPNQALAVCHFPEWSAPAFDFSSGFTFYLDDIRDPGNFGTILRLADWFGISELFCSEKSCELYNSKVIQASMGAFMRVRVHYLPLNELLKTATVRQVYGAVLDGTDLYQEKLEHGLIVIGNEARGILPENLPSIHRKIRIPSPAGSGAESLNAAMAASIICAEFFRQLRST